MQWNRNYTRKHAYVEGENTTNFVDCELSTVAFFWCVTRQDFTSENEKPVFNAFASAIFECLHLSLLQSTSFQVEDMHTMDSNERNNYYHFAIWALHLAIELIIFLSLFRVCTQF